MSIIGKACRVRSRAHSRGPLLVLLCVMVSYSVSGDWLIGRDGERIETRGPWKVKRSSVIFTAANGSLSSLRLADVDLEASEKATAEAAAKPAAPVEKPAQPAKRSSIMRITTADVGRATERLEGDSEAAEDDDDSEETEVEESAATKQATTPIEVISWSQSEKAGVNGLEIVGTLRNASSSIVTGASVLVSLYDHDGKLVGRRDAFLDAVSIAGRATIGFRALFPGVDVFEGEPVFEVRAQELGLTLSSEERVGEP